MKEEFQVTKERNDAIEFKDNIEKTVLICTNGFQNADIHDAVNMRDYFLKNFSQDYANCEIRMVKLFDPSVTKTHRAKKYEKILDAVIKEYIDKQYNIILLGYSFSAALAAKFQYRYRKYIRRLILVAPIYDTVVNNMIYGYLQYVIKFKKLSKKYGSAVAKAMGRKTTKGMVGLLLSILNSVLRCRSYYHDVDCDTLIIRGEDDNLCTLHALNKAKSEQANQVVYSYKGMNHGILKTVRDNGPVYEDILHFAFNTPYIIKQEITVKDYEEKEKIPSFTDIFSELDPEDEESYKQDQEAL